MKIYFFSGLGADKSVFQFLNLSYCEPFFAEWIAPCKNESLRHYALRFKDHYRIPDDAIIVGLSFGGMLATEIIKENAGMHAILISSAKTKQELPSLYQMGKYFPIHNWTTSSMQRWFMLNIKELFDLKNPLYIRVYEELIKEADIKFNKWAVNALLHWDNTTIPDNIIHIHGTNDKILPYKRVKCDYIIKGGGHFMVMEQEAIISNLVHDIVNRLQVPSSSASLFVHHHPA